MKCNATRAQEGPLKITAKRRFLKRKENWRKLPSSRHSGLVINNPNYCSLLLYRHYRNLAEGGCLLSQFHSTLCRYFLGHVIVACRNLPWQFLFLISNSGSIFLRVCLHSFLIAGFIFTVNKRFPDIVLMCWTQLFSVACRILKLLLKLPYSCSMKKYTATRSTVLLATVNSKPFHVNIKE